MQQEQTSKRTVESQSTVYLDLEDSNYVRSNINKKKIKKTKPQGNVLLLHV